MNNRKPNWVKWQHIPNPKVWQVVALSLDIDPDNVTRDRDDWMAGGGYVNHEGKDFRDMLDIISSNYSTIDPTPRTLSMNGIEYNELNIARFAYWAILKHIEIPDEMKALANTQTTSEKEMFDVNDTKYPRELDIAFKAWQEVSKMPNIKVSPKTQIRQWLDKNYNDRVLSDAAKERIASVANWKKTGGAPTTE